LDAPEPGQTLLQVSRDLQIRRRAAPRRRTRHHPCLILLRRAQSWQQKNEK
jgi:hypothetical protein